MDILYQASTFAIRGISAYLLSKLSLLRMPVLMGAQRERLESEEEASFSSLGPAFID
jgi:hypothetical protein